MARPSRTGGQTEIPDLVNEIADEINEVLNQAQRERYFHCIILLYSFIENLLKWLVFAKILWIKSSKRIMVKKEARDMRHFCKRLTFYNCLRIALGLDLVPFPLYEKLDEVREERNDVVHQLWIYKHRRSNLVLRKKLEKLARASNSLVGVFNALTKEVGVDEIYELPPLREPGG
jgi:hypothetical protein